MVFMAIETVLRLVTRLDEVQKEIAVIKERLNYIKSVHEKFWEILQQECEKTWHDLTQAQIDAYKNDVNAIHVFGKCWISHVCPYCKGYVGCRRNHVKSADVFSRKTFETWLIKDTNGWPQEKKSLFERGKKELKEYFAEAENLESRFEELCKEENEIHEQLREIWSLCDVALGKDTERAAEEARTERIIRNLSGIPSRDDVYYPD